MNKRNEISENVLTKIQTEGVFSEVRRNVDFIMRMVTNKVSHQLLLSFIFISRCANYPKTLPQIHTKQSLPCNFTYYHNDPYVVFHFPLCYYSLSLSLYVCAKSRTVSCSVAARFLIRINPSRGSDHQNGQLDYTHDGR